MLKSVQWQAELPVKILTDAAQELVKKRLELLERNLDELEGKSFDEQSSDISQLKNLIRVTVDEDDRDVSRQTLNMTFSGQETSYIHHTLSTDYGHKLRCHRNRANWSMFGIHLRRLSKESPKSSS